MAKGYEYCRMVLDSGRYGQQQGRYPYFIRVSLDYYGANGRHPINSIRIPMNLKALTRHGVHMLANSARLAGK